jgi:type I restriction enzyme, S subunit
MGSEWPTCSLKEVGVQLIDCDHKTPKAQESGFPYIGIPQMKNGNIDFDADPRLITETDLVTWTRKAKPQTHDVILSRRCNPGETAYVGTRTEFALGQNLVILRAADERVFPPYLRWVVRSHQWWAEVSKYLNPGAVFDSLKCADIPKFEVPFPPLPEQKAIAHILGTLDDKIELNRRMNATLEAMAQALFKSWFVDFDPVIDNALAAGNPIPDELAPRAEVRKNALANGTSQQGSVNHPTLSDPRSLFPAAFEFNDELGWIPEGWGSATLGDYLEIKRGGSPRPIHDFLRPEGLPWVKIADATASPSRFLFGTKEFIKPEGLKKTVLMKKGSLILSNSATPGLPMFLELDACIHDGWLYFPEKKHFGDLYLYQLFLVIKEELLAQGNGSVFTNLKTDILRAQRIVVPSAPLLDVFEDWMTPNFEKIRAVNVGARSLERLRDTLLPNLISGELRIHGGNHQLEAGT